MSTAAAEEIDAHREAQPRLFAQEPAAKASLSQWYTPPSVAEQIADWVTPWKPRRILDPAAGTGNLLRPFKAPGVSLYAAEVDPMHREPLEALGAVVTIANFLRQVGVVPLGSTTRFDMVVMNPPYENDADIAFLHHAMKVTNHVVAVLRSAFRHGDGRYREVWRRYTCLRIAELIDRPKFGEGPGARSDFAVFHFFNQRPSQRQRIDWEHWYA